MSGMLLQMQKEEIWERMKEERKQIYAKSVKGLLHKPKKIKESETRIDLFKRMTFTIRDENGCVFTNLEDVNIWDTIRQCSQNGLDRLYDRVYYCYLSNTITPLEWCAFENLLFYREYTSSPANDTI